MNKIKFLEEQIAALQVQLENAKRKDIQWDNLSGHEMWNVIKSNPDWNTWEVCPVGSLLSKEDRIVSGFAPKDPILYQLGMIVSCVKDEDLSALVRTVREIATLRLKELHREQDEIKP